MSTTVRLFKHQALFLQSPYVFPSIRFHFLIAGYAAGKTSALIRAVEYCVYRLQGLVDKEGHNPKVMVVSRNLTFLKKTLIGLFIQDLKATETQYIHDKANNIFYIGNVEVILIAGENPENVYGYDVCSIFIDELDELETQKSMELVKSVNDRARQNVVGFRHPFLCFSTTSQGLKGTYQTVMHFQKSGISHIIIRARTRDNLSLDKDYVRNMYKIYNEKETQCLLEGKFISIDSGLVFPDYNPAKNKLDVDLFDTVKEDEIVYIPQDFNAGFNCAQAYIIREGAIICIKDYKIANIARAPEIFRYDFPLQEIVWIPDMTYKEHFNEFKKELRAFNIKIAYRSCNPLVNDRNFACNKLFHAEHLFICPICKMTDTALLTHQKDPKTGKPTKGAENSPDHLNDCMGYAVHYLLSWRKELKPLYDVTLRRIYDKRRARGSAAVELEVPARILRAQDITLKDAVNVVEEAEYEEIE